MQPVLITKLKIVLPVGKARAWQLIATPSGLSSWFPRQCYGSVCQGGALEFVWSKRNVERFHVLYVGDKHSSLNLTWRNEARLRFYLHGKWTTASMQVEYPDTRKGRTAQLAELPHLGFFMANLKSVGLGGVDLRTKLPRNVWDTLFLD